MKENKFSLYNLVAGKRPLKITGPCSVESEDQIHATAKQLADTGSVDVLRGGIWKPRSRPGNFAGIGNEGLNWLKEAGNDIGVPVTAEVGNTQHVEDALKAGIDILWLGARTTVNPFYVQEIANALKGVDVKVLVKNPINPDLSLWIGAIERILECGDIEVGAVHRGFSSYETHIYRNIPMWRIPIELKSRYPNIPMFNDPSHITGNREYLLPVMQKAMDLNFDGWMIESHPDPKNAKSDADQQITPQNLSDLIGEIVIREGETQDVVFNTQLELLRSRIDELDESMIRVLVERFNVIGEIGGYKRDNDVRILQEDRWKEICHRVLDMANQFDLNPTFVQRILNEIHEESIRIQSVILSQKTTVSK